MNEAGLKVLPESTHEWDEVKNSDTPEIFWDRITNLRTKFGTGLFKPGKDAGKEDWGKFSTKAIELSDNRLIPRPDLDDEEQRSALLKSLGRPDEAGGYDFAEIEGGNLSDDRKKFVSELAFKAGLTKSQLKLMDETMRGADVAMRNGAVQVQKEALTALTQEWGLASPDRMSQAEKVAKVFFPHLGKEPVLSAEEYKSFFSLSKQLGKSTQEFKDQGDQLDTGLDPKEAAAKIAEIRGNNKHAYYDMHSPGHAAAKKLMHDLYRVKNRLAPD